MPDKTYPTTLRKFIVKHFDWEELRTLCQDVGVDFDSLRGEGEEGKARELVTYMERHLRLDELITALSKQREKAWEEKSLDKLFTQKDDLVQAHLEDTQQKAERSEREESTDTADEARKPKVTLASAAPLISSFLGFLVGVLGNLAAAWIQQDLLGNAFTPPRIALIVLLAVAGLGAGVWIQRQQPLSGKQWAGISVGFLVLMVSIVIVFTLEKSNDTNHSPSIQKIVASPSTLLVGHQATLTAIATDADGDNLAYYWEAQRGTVPVGAQGYTITYTAPASGGLDTIKVTVTDGKASVSQEIRLSVLADDAPGQ